MKRVSDFSALVVCLTCACAGEAAQPTLPPPPPPAAPEENPFTASKAELGRHLFYDQRLSLRENVACASCHQQALAFSDGRAVSEGSTGQLTKRNASGLVNSAYAATLTSANFVLTTLEQQALVPLFGEDPIEHGLSGRDSLLIARLRAQQTYEALFQNAFPDETPTITVGNIARALASFERTLVSNRSAYDYYRAGESSALDGSARRGLALFESPRLACTGCHGGELFSSAFSWSAAAPGEAHFENNGLYAEYPIGNRGLYELTGKPEDEGRFRPPSLRNVALTAPYMHDGTLATLTEVIKHYERGGARGANQSALILGFTLTDGERADLLAFLDSLTDDELTTDPNLADPWQRE